MKVAFIHPDLGIGGAERLVIDAAVGLQSKGHEVKIYTSHCDPGHCFEEISSGVIATEVYGDFLPTVILGKLYILCAIVRQLYLTLRLVWSGRITTYDTFIVDQLSVCVPFLHLFKNPHAKILFYGHFPDQYLAQRTSTLKALYRKPFDFLEEVTTGCADKIVVNSNFTRQTFARAFGSTDFSGVSVVYPCVDTTVPNHPSAKAAVAKAFGTRFFLSVNRFERKKNVELAIEAFAMFRTTTPGYTLVVAGGFDSRVRENVEYLGVLEALVKSLGMTSCVIHKTLTSVAPVDVVFMPSVSSSLKDELLKATRALLYTPSNEHFGIVPLEGMRCGTVVVATNTGGPLESIVDGSQSLEGATGFNVEPKAAAWARTMTRIANDLSPVALAVMAANGVNRVSDRFSRLAMTEELERALAETVPVAWRGERTARLIVRVWKEAMIFVALALFFQGKILSSKTA